MKPVVKVQGTSICRAVIGRNVDGPRSCAHEEACSGLHGSVWRVALAQGCSCWGSHEHWARQVRVLGRSSHLKSLQQMVEGIVCSILPGFFDSAAEFVWRDGIVHRRRDVWQSHLEEVKWCPRFTAVRRAALGAHHCGKLELRLTPSLPFTHIRENLNCSLTAGRQSGIAWTRQDSPSVIAVHEALTARSARSNRR